MPFCRVEVAVMSLVDGRLQVLLAQRTEAPHAGKWALPGGVIRIDKDDRMEDVPRRVMRERLNMELPFLRQLCTVGGKTRDERALWALSVVYRALAPATQIAATPGKRVEALRWCPVEVAEADTDLAFDHAELVAKARQATRNEVQRLELPAGFLPATFTLSELQTTLEQMQGSLLDKSSFRRKLDHWDLVEAVSGAMQEGRGRPAQLFRLKNRT
jgi:ADP-ribose pyrophosphatase YjhB (NUDIX family)